MRQAATRMSKKAQNRASWSVTEFCGRNGFSRAHFYRLLNRGEGPRIFKVGAGTRVAVKAEREWIATREEIEILYPQERRVRRRRARAARRQTVRARRPRIHDVKVDDSW